MAHADYVLTNEGMHVRGRHDRARLITWSELQRLLGDGIGLLDVLSEIVGGYQKLYQEPKIVYGSTNMTDPEGCFLIHSDPLKRTMTISGGVGCTAESLLQKLTAERTSSDSRN